MQHETWLDFLAGAEGGALPLSPQARDALSEVDRALFAMWDLGDNVVLAWTHYEREMRFLSVRHYAIAEAIHGNPVNPAGMDNAAILINGVLSGSKYLAPEVFERVCKAFGSEPQVVRTNFRVGTDVDIGLVSKLVRRYSVSLVRGRAVVLLDAVEFSLQPPLDQVAMLNSLSFSVNSAYRQLLSKEIHVNFARTTTGDGFYIWSRDTSAEANIALYKLMMMILADNAIAQRKARSPWVPKLRAAFHIGEHYEFHQVEGLNPTTFSYIVGQVTVDLSRMIDKALPGQILLGDFDIRDEGKTGTRARYDTLDFVEKTAATLDQLKGLSVSGGRIDNIRCYLTGQSFGGGRYLVNRYHIRDKHGTTRIVYNAKINIHRENAEPIFLGIQREDLWAFPTTKVEALNRDAEQTGSFFIKP
ncbi:MAG TPA: hypothetical protein VFB20_01220 [Burkholderiales bacterium]|nr:hypothetical protein [Burkholderiales bacterium]